MSKPVPSRMPPRVLPPEQAAFIRSLEPVSTPQNDATTEATERLVDQAPDHPGDESTRRPIASTAAPTARSRSKGAKPHGRALFTRASGDAVRKLSFYFPPELARDLQLHCVAQDQDMSAFVTDLVRRALARRGG